MRHADIRTTINVYGTVVTEEMATASEKVARLVVNGTGDGTGPAQVMENLAERVGFELTSERKFKNMQRTGCAF